MNKINGVYDLITPPAFPSHKRQPMTAKHMKKLKQAENLAKLFIGLTAATIVGLAPTLYADESSATTPVPTNSAPAVASPAAPADKPVKKSLTGAELYSIHCNRCHPERYPTERTAAQWKTIMLHMQIRANLPGKQARLILQYLQENSGR
jgi:cytochrome c5